MTQKLNENNALNVINTGNILRHSHLYKNSAKFSGQKNTLQYGGSSLVPVLIDCRRQIIKTETRR